MKTLIQKGMGAFAGFAVVLLCAAALAPAASAQAYYYPVVSYQTYGPYGSYGSNAKSQAEIQALMNQLYALMAQLQALQAKAGHTYTTYTPTKPVQHTYKQSGYKSYDVDVETVDVDVEGDDEATFYGEVDIDDADYVHVWFIYGTDSDLDEETEDIKLTDDDDFEIDVDDLEEDERYFVRAVAEDPSGHLTYGEIIAFTTGDEDDDDDDNNDEDVPEVETGDAENIDEDSAELHGEVDMNDFEDGLVFMIYGEDEDAVDEVEDENAYSDVDEDGDDLQKVQLFSSIDGSRSFWVSIFGLDEDTEYFYRACVEYEDEDDDEALECGSVESFATDED